MIKGNNADGGEIMETRFLTAEILEDFSNYLIREEKSVATVEKYTRDVHYFWEFLQVTNAVVITKDCVLSYKEYLVKKNYAIRSINSMLASINSLLDFMGLSDCKVKSIRLQQQIYCAEEKELTKAEYQRLLVAAERDRQLYLVMQTICSTGIRVSELQFFTVDAIKKGEIFVNCKGKTRMILIPRRLRKILLDYAKRKKCGEGPIFVGRRQGKPLNRQCIWAKMKVLCQGAGVRPSKVFPHNLRKLFARTFYQMEKDIAKLADILGHSSINTTRIYIMTTGMEHRKKIERLGLII